MQSSSLETWPVGSLLFVRRAEDIPATLRTLNQLLWHRRFHGSIDDVILGILVGEDLERPFYEMVQGSREPEIIIREVLSISQTWSLCWFESRFVWGKQERNDRICRILDCFYSRDSKFVARCPLSAPNLFAPVSFSLDSGDTGGKLADTLRVRYPSLGFLRESFTYHPATGGIIKNDEWRVSVSRELVANRSN